MANNAINSDPRKRRSVVALLSAAGYGWRYVLRSTLLRKFWSADKAIIYGFWIVAVGLWIQDLGFGRTMLWLSVLLYLFGVWRIVFDLTLYLRGYFVKCTAIDYLMCVYVPLFTLYALYKLGLERRALILLFPIFSGLVFALAAMFKSSTVYRKTNILEKKVWRALKQKMRKRT